MPGISFLVPWYIIFSRLNLMDSYVALILSHMLIALPIVVWIMATYFSTIPPKMEESAMVDGATRQYAFWAIILPLSGPGIITATTLVFHFFLEQFHVFAGSQHGKDEDASYCRSQLCFLCRS